MRQARHLTLTESSIMLLLAAATGYWIYGLIGVGVALGICVLVFIYAIFRSL